MQRSLIAVLCSGCMFLACASLAQTPHSDSSPATQDFRPAFHFSPDKNWINDPNGLIYFHSEYHLFYQYNPFGNLWGHMSWGHAVSRDLVSWKELPVALKEEDGIMMFSGSAVVDWKNTSGFGKNGDPPLVAIYTGATQNLQNQNIAYSTDSGRTWTKYSGNPVLDIHDAEFRDPMVFWYAPKSRWVMAVSLAKQHRIRFYSSSDLKDWKATGEFGPAGAIDVPNWECPSLFPLKDPKGRLKWVLIVGVGDGAPSIGSATQYFVGDFDGERFISDDPAAKTLWVDFGGDFYAAQSWSDIPAQDGRRIIVAWMNNWKYADKVPTHPWRGQMTFPRTVSLADTSDGLRLAQNPIREIQSLRKHHVSLKNAKWTELQSLLRNHKWPSTLEIIATLQLDATQQFAFELRKGAEHNTRAGFDAQRNTFFIDRTYSGSALPSPEFLRRHDAPRLRHDRRVQMHILLDRSSVELFGDQGTVAITDLIFPDSSDNGLDVSVTGAPPKIVSLDLWTLTK